MDPNGPPGHPHNTRVILWVTDQDLAPQGPQKVANTDSEQQQINRAKTIKISKWDPVIPPKWPKMAPNCPKWPPTVSTSPAGSYKLPRYMISVIWGPKKGPKHTQNGPRLIFRSRFFHLVSPQNGPKWSKMAQNGLKRLP